MGKPSPAAIQKLKIQKKLLQQEVLMYQSITEGIRDNLSWEEVLKLIIQCVTKGLGFDRAGIFMLRPDGKATELVMGIDGQGRYEKGIVHAVQDREDLDPFSSLLFRRKKYFLTNNVEKRRSTHKDGWGKYDPLPQDPKRFVNNAVVPIQIGGGIIIGLLAVDNFFNPRFIKKSDIAILANFATQAGMVLESFQLHQKIINLTITDPLTGVFNRRYFDRCLFTEIARSQRYGRPCGLLYADVDFFKSVNDRWGHSVGDEVLKNVAISLRSGVRNLDTVCRIGGEEFAIVLPETSAEGMKRVAERLVEGVANNTAAGESERVTISIGLSCYPNSSKDASVLIQLADQSLYQAKAAGRNRVGPLVTPSNV